VRTSEQTLRAIYTGATCSVNGWSLKE